MKVAKIVKAQMGEARRFDDAPPEPSQVGRIDGCTQRRSEDQVVVLVGGARGQPFLQLMLALLAGRGKKPYTTRGLHKLVATAAKAAGIDKPVSPHWLRHSFATLAAVGGALAYQLQADLGHARLETSQRYVHRAKRLADSAVDRLPTGLLPRQ